VTLFAALQAPSQATQRPLLVLQGVVAGTKGYLLARLVVEQRLPLFVVTPDVRQRDLLYDDLRCFLADFCLASPTAQGLDDLVCRYDPQPAAVAGVVAYQQHRALYTYQPLWRLLGPDPVVVVAAVESLRYGVVPPAHLQQRLLTVRSGELLSPQSLVMSLVERGYRRLPLVETVGECSLRGGILDLFSPGQSHPWRLEFFGDEVETIRTFEVQSQTSVAALQQIMIAPMHPLSWQQRQDAAAWARLQAHLQAQTWSEILVTAGIERWRNQSPAEWPEGMENFFYEAVYSPLAYVPPTGRLCCVDAEDVRMVLRQLPAAQAMRCGTEIVSLPADSLIAASTLQQQLQDRIDVSLTSHTALAASQASTVFRPRGAPQFFGGIDRFITQLRQWQEEGFCTLILCRLPFEVQRMQGFLANYELGSRALAACVDCLSDTTLQPGAILLAVGELSQGFVFPELRFVVLRDVDIFGAKQSNTTVSSRPRGALLDFGTLRAGDRVVHIDYGIGRYRRMTFLDVGRDSGEFMELEYADAATLYVPSYRLSMVQKYSGSDSDDGPMDRLGGTTWARMKERVRASLLDMAESLVQLHAVRQTNDGYSFSPQTALHREFESHFEYAETEDQLRAIEDIMADMERPRPMERLVCGDVGYGKTEVAMRAAFKAVYDGKQVAVLVPTTVLAQQHYDTFQQRFAAYPVQVGLLSRPRSRQEQRQVLAGLRQGTIDIVIGTHRLLQKDIHFKDLGLLVVDEEHRFGVAHKEKIKRFSAKTDALMLSATPIPRSLHMTLVGLRDYSMIETPPEGRSAIQTTVVPFSEETIQQAIQQELGRGGQVFFVHNRIEALPALQALLTRLVPECRVGIAHGQIPENGLEKIMLQFLRREFDLLLCTTIIESGLDIPSVNTIIINRAEQFGLAQLYQLRGRVGRSTQQAYAYLLLPGDLLLADTARKRLEAMEEFSQLGSSVQLAARDLEIRGAGNLLGAQQSGHIASIGFDLYCQMLAEAIRTTRGEAVSVRVDPELRLEVQGHIPSTYVDNEAQRLELYRRLATVETDDALDTLRQELVDRFGPLPPALQRLLAVVGCKILARHLALERIEQQRDAMLLTFHPQTPVDSTALLQWLQSAVPDFRFHSERVVRLPLSGDTPEGRLALLKKHLRQLLASVSI
jgi:transcription-repair coupling factor (superfamily II helicase)